jgi:hypothetical protein
MTYKLFLNDKADSMSTMHDFKTTEKCSPSVAIDEVWHAHLSMLDWYQKDIQTMT